LKLRLHAFGIGVTILALMSVGTGAIASGVHTVSKGDTLWSIAKRFGVTVRDITSANNLISGKPLKIGTKLTVRSKDGTPNQQASERDGATSLSGKASKRFGPRAVRQIEERTESGEPPTDVVRTALAYRGSRYVRGGTGRRGFDCSGFTSYIYGKYGVRLPHSSSAQASCGTPVSKSDLQPGDLLFFQTRGHRISHVGIYVGGTKFVHASTPRGGVMVSSLGEAYYARRYKMARRIDPNG
jgi:cell wall-associated NlpC family hydrolase